MIGDFLKLLDFLIKPLGIALLLAGSFGCRTPQGVQSVHADTQIKNAEDHLQVEDPSPSFRATLDPGNEACRKAAGSTIHLSKNGNLEPFCEIDRALISQSTLLRHLQNSTPLKASKILRRNPGLKRDKSRRGRKLKKLSMGNPSVLFCLQQRGLSETLYGPEGSVAVCRFKDGSAMASWTLFKGATASKALSNILFPNLDTKATQSARRKK